jgi:hypothetical protein
MSEQVATGFGGGAPEVNDAKPAAALAAASACAGGAADGARGGATVAALAERSEASP